jgi:ribosome-associated protein
MTTEPEDRDEPPSKSSRKRAAHAAQALGERLVAMRDAELAALPLSEILLDAIREARRLTTRGGLVRQRQYIGKLMREIDTAAIEQALASKAAGVALDSQRFQRVESWRDRLVAEGAPALEELAQGRTDLDQAGLAALMDRARDAARSPRERATAARELFRALRTLFNAA